MIKNETVVLLHGIARTKRSMFALEKALVKDGYHVLNIDYPSRKKSIPELAAIIFNEMQPAFQDTPRWHFVGHSMGCLIIRELLSKFPVKPVGKIVMLAPPNQGSEVADFLKDNFLYQRFYGPAGQELTTQWARERPFPLLQHTLGVIAGNRCIDPFSYYILPHGNDGKVTIDSTKLDGMDDHIVLPCSHSFIMNNRLVIEQVQYFLKNGQFKKTPLDLYNSI